MKYERKYRLVYLLIGGGVLMGIVSAYIIVGGLGTGRGLFRAIYSFIFCAVINPFTIVGLIMLFWMRKGRGNSKPKGGGPEI